MASERQLPVNYDQIFGVDCVEEEVFTDHEYPDGEEEEDNVEVSRRLFELEEEQEQLNSSLIALTSHFAQVQLRLKQIVDAEADEKEKLLKELEEFAFRGIPDFREPVIDLALVPNDADVDGTDFDDDQRIDKFDRSLRRVSSCEVSKLELQRIKQKQLISKLKDQLEDLEKYAYETGDLNAIPSSMLLERQTVVIEQLKGKLALNLDEMDKLSPEDLRKQVDKAVRDIVNPAIMKEQLVEQLKTQVSDLERFIHYLQIANNDSMCHSSSKSDCTCHCPMHGNAQTGLEKYDAAVAAKQCKSFKNRTRTSSEGDSRQAMQIIKRVMTLLQMITFAQFGCSRTERRFERNILKRTTKGNHWGDLRARLELAIDHILEVDKEKFAHDSDYTSDSDDSQFSRKLGNEKMTSAVRKELAPALRDLLEHGLDFYSSSNSNQSLILRSMFDWGCFSDRSAHVAAADTVNSMTVWDLILKFYEFKNGGLLNATPARRLSQSFNLQIVGRTAITPKQTLLTAIDEIIETHTPLKRSPDAHFKALVSQALNEGRLITWLKLVVKSRRIVETFYEPWSYVASTGFDDAFKSLEKLSAIKFHIPTDLAIRQLRNISDAF
ncbi:RUN domain-containing protein 1 [Halotydeus destructor]|nr:RUN domain-containing protein 1 [Halotydeus destructor]